ncbi:SapB/AmfS family lanthipeptide [Actinoplanes subtropicus]|nr:SapB/AmfS family lanthipeptide [Actinoplanes subtropicus]
MALLDLQAMEVDAEDEVKLQTCSSVVPVDCTSTFSVFC